MAARRFDGGRAASGRRYRRGLRRAPSSGSGSRHADVIVVGARATVPSLVVGVELGVVGLVVTVIVVWLVVWLVVVRDATVGGTFVALGARRSR